MQSSSPYLLFCSSFYTFFPLDCSILQALEFILNEKTTKKRINKYSWKFCFSIPQKTDTSAFQPKVHLWFFNRKFLWLFSIGILLWFVYFFFHIERSHAKNVQRIYEPFAFADLLFLSVESRQSIFTWYWSVRIRVFLVFKSIPILPIFRESFHS